MKNLEMPNSSINIFDLEAVAKTKLSTLAYDYYSSGACDEKTLAANIAAFQDVWLRPRMLVDVSQRSMETTILGNSISAPIILAPAAFQGLADAEGERASARAAQKFGTTMCLSTLANFSIEEVRDASKGNLWFQLYVYKDKSVTRSLIERAEAAGYTALVLTVDSPLLGRRERDVRNKFNLPAGLVCKNLIGNYLEQLPPGGPDSGLASYIASLYDTSLTWKDLEWFKSITKLPVVVKGILRGDDANRAIEYGAGAIVVSNHGGRQLDTTIPTIHALPEVVSAVGGRVEVYLDGGIRRGTDVLKALALGARAVLIGRPFLWGLAVAGQSGVSTVLEMLRSEFDLAMALSGCATIGDITPDLVDRTYKQSR
ncbi:MAG TPA: alpha-hydroxy acid oxidase [Drouetiella sp.]